MQQILCQIKQQVTKCVNTRNIETCTVDAAWRQEPRAEILEDILPEPTSSEAGLGGRVGLQVVSRGLSESQRGDTDLSHGALKERGLL